MFETEDQVRPGVLRLGDLVAERKTVTVVRDGHEIALLGYVWGRRIPRGVEARVSQAYQDLPKTYEAKIDPVTHEPLLDEHQQPQMTTKFDMSDYSEMLTRVACTLVEGLSPLEAEVMTFKEIRALLVYLNYLKDQEVEQQENHPLDGQSPTTTGEKSPSDSQPSLASVGANN